MTAIVNRILRYSYRILLLTLAISTPIFTSKQKESKESILVNSNNENSSQENGADKEFLLGNDFYQKGDFKNAVMKYKIAIGMNPTVASYYLNLGNCLREMTNYEDSVMFLQKAIYLNVDSSKNWYSLGVTYQYMGMYDEAILAYNNATSISDDFLNAHYNKGSCLFS